MSRFRNKCTHCRCCCFYMFCFVESLFGRAMNRPEASDIVVCFQWAREKIDSIQRENNLAAPPTNKQNVSLERTGLRLSMAHYFTSGSISRKVCLLKAHCIYRWIALDCIRDEFWLLIIDEDTVRRRETTYDPFQIRQLFIQPSKSNQIPCHDWRKG